MVVFHIVLRHHQTMREMREKAEEARQEAHQIRERMTEEKGAEKDRLRKEAQAKDEEARKYRINLQTEEGKLKRAQGSQQRIEIINFVGIQRI